jgi:23S rRNA U2552 (ribose-2'-O)-methylase RlmE/FtsJ
VGQLRDRKHRHDTFFRKAREEGFAARAVYKLEDIDRRVRLFHLARACSISGAGQARGCSMRARLWAHMARSWAWIA